MRFLVFCRQSGLLAFFYHFRAIALWLVSWLVLAGCETRPARQPGAATAPAVASPAASSASAPARPAAAAPRPARADARPTEPEEEPAPPALEMRAGELTQYRRYVGTLGSQPVVVELFTGREYVGQEQPVCRGHYYDARRGTTKTFSSEPFYPRKQLRLAASSYDDTDSTEHWQLRQPLGPRLTGTVTAANKPRRRLTLRENYTDAVPLAIGTAQMYGNSMRLHNDDNREELHTFAGSVLLQYVRLLGRAAHQPRLQRILSSRPAELRAELREEFSEDSVSLYSIKEELSLDLNDYGILSYSKYVSDYEDGGNHSGASFPAFTFDLRTGRPITLASLVKPGNRKALMRLALRYLDPNYRQELSNFYNSPSNADALKDDYDALKETFGLSPKGLTLQGLLGPYALGPTIITIPYAALRPLLRPRTPLNRVLVARGLQPVL